MASRCQRAAHSRGRGSGGNSLGQQDDKSAALYPLGSAKGERCRLRWLGGRRKAALTSRSALANYVGMYVAEHLTLILNRVCPIAGH